MDLIPPTMQSYLTELILTIIVFIVHQSWPIAFVYCSYPAAPYYYQFNFIKGKNRLHIPWYTPHSMYYQPISTYHWAHERRQTPDWRSTERTYNCRNRWATLSSREVCSSSPSRFSPFRDWCHLGLNRSRRQPSRGTTAQTPEASSGRWPNTSGWWCCPSSRTRPPVPKCSPEQLWTPSQQLYFAMLQISLIFCLLSLKTGCTLQH